MENSRGIANCTVHQFQQYTGRKSEKATGRKAPLALYFQNFTGESLRYFYHVPAATVQRAFCRFFACTVTNIKSFADTSMFSHQVHRSVEVWKASLFCSTNCQKTPPVCHWPGWWPLFCHWPACQPAWPSIPEDCSSRALEPCRPFPDPIPTNWPTDPIPAAVTTNWPTLRLANWAGRNDQSFFNILVSTYFEIRLP